MEDFFLLLSRVFYCRVKMFLLLLLSSPPHNVGLSTSLTAVNTTRTSPTSALIAIKDI